LRTTGLEVVCSQYTRSPIQPTAKSVRPSRRNPRQRKGALKPWTRRKRGREVESLGEKLLPSPRATGSMLNESRPAVQPKPFQLPDDRGQWPASQPVSDA